MKIGSLDSKPTVAPMQNDRKSDAAGKAAGSGTAAAAEPSATVQISDAASIISSADDGSFDAAKVQRMAQAIRDGKFEVNADAIADKLIANTQEILRKYSS